MLSSTVGDNWCNLQTNDAYNRMTEYQQKTSALKIALSLQQQPLGFYPLVASVHKSHVTLTFPKSLRSIMRSIEVQLRHLLYPGATVERAKSSINVKSPVKVRPGSVKQIRGLVNKSLAFTD